MGINYMIEFLQGVLFVVILAVILLLLRSTRKPKILTKLGEILLGEILYDNEGKGKKKIKNGGVFGMFVKALAGSIIGAIVICLIAFSIAIVPAGHVGVHDLFGVVNPDELQSGFRWKNPFAHVEMMSVKTQEYTMSIVAEEGAITGVSDTISALTEEGLSVDLDITVLYRLQPEKADMVYRSIGINYVGIIVRPQIRSAIREVIARYEAKNIYSEDRAEIENEIFNRINKETEPRGIIIERVLLRNVQLPQELKEAIDRKKVAEQRIETKEFEVETERKEAERKIVEAGGIAEANRIISQSLTRNYLTWYWIQNLGKHNSVLYVPVGEYGLPLFKDIDKINESG